MTPFTQHDLHKMLYCILKSNTYGEDFKSYYHTFPY